jgi:flagellar protein FliS
MSLQNPYAKYRTTQAQTATQLRLIIMLHDGATRFLQQATMAIAANDLGKQALYFSKAYAVLAHLSQAVRPDRSEVAANLDRIYGYLQQRCMLANANNDPAIIEEITDHLRTLRDALDTIDRKPGQLTDDNVSERKMLRAA